MNSPIEGDRGVCLYLFISPLFIYSYIFLIDSHVTFLVPDDIENTYPRFVSPFRKGGKGDLNFYLLRHCEERPVGRGNLILYFYNDEKMRSSRGKAPLRMTVT